MADFIMASPVLDDNSPVDRIERFQQWNNLRNFLTNFGSVAVLSNSNSKLVNAEYQLTSPNIGQHVSVFENNFILYSVDAYTPTLDPKHTNFISASLRAANFQQTELAHHFDPLNCVLDENANTIWVGLNENFLFEDYSELSKQLSDKVTYCIRPLEMRNGYAQLSLYFNVVNGIMLIHSDAFTEHSLYTLEVWYDLIHRIEVEEYDCESGGINSIVCENTMITSGVSDDLKKSCELKGIELVEIDISAILDAGTKCLAVTYK